MQTLFRQSFYIPLLSRIFEVVPLAVVLVANLVLSFLATVEQGFFTTGACSFLREQPFQ